MTRREAEERAQLWLAVSGLLEGKPEYEKAHQLCNVIFNITDGAEVYTTGFMYDVWRILQNGQY